MVVLGVLACLLFGFALLSRRLDGTSVTAPMVFVGAGLAAQWIGIVDFGAATHREGPSHEVLFVVAAVLAPTDAALGQAVVASPLAPNQPRSGCSPPEPGVGSRPFHAEIRVR